MICRHLYISMCRPCIKMMEYQFQCTDFLIDRGKIYREVERVTTVVTAWACGMAPKWWSMHVWKVSMPVVQTSVLCKFKCFCLCFVSVVISLFILVRDSLLSFSSTSTWKAPKFDLKLWLIRVFVIPHFKAKENDIIITIITLSRATEAATTLGTKI